MAGEYKNPAIFGATEEKHEKQAGGVSELLRRRRFPDTRERRYRWRRLAGLAKKCS